MLVPAFLPLPTMFSTLSKTKSIIEPNFCRQMLFKSLRNNKLVDWPKMKAFADDKINVTQNLKFVFEWIENIVWEKR